MATTKKKTTKKPTKSPSKQLSIPGADVADELVRVQLLVPKGTAETLLELSARIWPGARATVSQIGRHALEVGMQRLMANGKGDAK